LTDITERASFEIIRYANCWEDAAILLEGLQIAPGMRCLSIASGGDNSLALLARDPEIVVAADFSGAQLALADLKRAAIERCDRGEFLAFLGFRPANADRIEIYQGLRSTLRPESRGFWDGRRDIITSGAIHAGKFERYFRLFRRRILPLVHSYPAIMSLLEPKSQGERTAYYRDRWDSWRWGLLFRIFFSRFVMGRMGRDPEFFRYVEGSVAERILKRVEHALTVLPGNENPYMHYILAGSFGDALPLYASDRHYDSVRRNIDRLRLFQGGADAASERFGIRFHACNLSDIFEYMGEEQFRQVAARIVAGCEPGARLAYWNMLAPRSIAEILPERVENLKELSEELHLRDRAFFYQAFRVDRLLPDGGMKAL
jgi:S-adenosylmethionine-diacylglycerol 3-amino-3-carboxypropyl transferase